MRIRVLRIEYILNKVPFCKFPYNSIESSGRLGNATQGGCLRTGWDSSALSHKITKISCAIAPAAGVWVGAFIKSKRYH